MTSVVTLIVLFAATCVWTGADPIDANNGSLEFIEVGPLKSYRIDSAGKPVTPSVSEQPVTDSSDTASHKAILSAVEGFAETDQQFIYKGKPIHPSLVCEFLTRITDKDFPLTVSVDIAAAFDTNEYYSSVQKDETGAVVCKNAAKGTTDGYRWFGRLTDGSHVVYAWEDDGNRLFPRNLFFIKFSPGKGFMPDGTGYERLLMTATRWYLPFDARSQVNVSDDTVVITMDGEEPITLKTPDAKAVAGYDDDIGKGLKEIAGSFTYKGEPIHPGIIQEFTGYLSDHGFPISVSIDLAASAGSNEYFEDDVKQPQPGIYSVSEEDPESFFSYQWCGSMADGTHVVRTGFWGGGSGIFGNLYFLQCTENTGYMPDGSAYNRLLITAVRWFPLGDRSGAEVQVFPDKVVVSRSTSGKESITLYVAN